MAPTANDFLQVAENDNDHLDTYDSENEVSKGQKRNTKRRRLNPEVDVDASSDAEADDMEQGIDDDDDDDEDDDDDQGEDAEEASDNAKKRPETTDIKVKPANTSSRPLSKKNLVATEEARKKSGVVYLSRIPPFMKPAKLRSLLTPYGAVNRMFLTPEDATARARRVRGGGNKKRFFTEGWVEFVRKRDARAACDLLNAQTIGGPKGSYYRDDVWSLRYLRGFKWHHLTAQMAAEDAERAARLRADMSHAARANRDFVRNVEHAKRLDGIARSVATRKRKADEQDEEEEKAGPSFSTAQQLPSSTSTRGRKPTTFQQVPLATKGTDMAEQPERVTRVLSKIF